MLQKPLVHISKLPLVSICGTSYKANIEHMSYNGNSIIIGTNQRRFFRLSQQAYDLLLRVGELNRDSEETVTSAALNAFFHSYLCKNGIYGSEKDKESVRQSGSGAGRLGWHFELVSGNRVTSILKPLINQVDSKKAFLLAALSAITVTAFCLSDALSVSYKHSIPDSPYCIPVIILLTLIGGLIHELGHATCCIRYAGQTGGIGFGVYTVLPVLYADVSDLHLVPPKQKAIIGLGGIAGQTIYSALLVPFSAYNAVESYIWLSLLQILVAIIPFHGSDGHWVVTDLSGTDDLTLESFRRIWSGKASMWNVIYAIFSLTALCAIVAWTLFVISFLAPYRIVYLAGSRINFKWTIELLILLVQCLAPAIGITILCKKIVRAISKRRRNVSRATKLGYSI